MPIEFVPFERHVCMRCIFEFEHSGVFTTRAAEVFGERCPRCSSAIGTLAEINEEARLHSLNEFEEC
mgnify:FL=1